MNEVKLGLLIKGDQQKDAIHIAVAPVIADQPLEPGAHVGLIRQGSDHAGLVKNPIGIVDPFLKKAVKQGERFWLFLYPNTVTSLRHEWTHPAFDSAPVPVVEELSAKVAASMAWLQEYASSINVTVDYVIAEATGNGDDCITADGVDQHGWDYEGGSLDDFWHHIEAVTGKTFSERRRESVIFSCSC